MIKYYLLASLAFLFLTACEKKEKPITLPIKGDGQMLQVNMGETYKYQFYINLEEQKIVHVSKIDSWDLALQSGSNDDAIFLNGGKGMAAYNTNKTAFQDVSFADTLQAKSQWSYDSPTGLSDSSAIGDWKTSRPVYLIRLDETGSKVRKLQITYEDQFQYTLAVGDISSTIPATITVVKDPTCNFTYFSFSLLTTVADVEPAKSTWDLQITKYNYTFYEENPPLRYIVNGVLLNPTSTFAYKDSLTTYNAINVDFATSVPLSNLRDVIGYDWKFIDFTATNPTYTIINKYNYIVKNQNNHFFKLHFLDFYSPTGIKGSPKFEFYQLN
jgi:hypothetical protein